MHVQIRILLCTRVEAREGCLPQSLFTSPLHIGLITKLDSYHFGLAVELLSSQDPPVSDSQHWSYSHTHVGAADSSSGDHIAQQALTH